MQRGIIGVPVQERDRLTTVESYHSTREEYGFDLHAAIEPTEQRRLDGGVEFIEGSALKEEADSDSKWIYDEDEESINKRQARIKVQQQSRFVAVPATDSQNGFAMVSSSDGEFAFSVIGRADRTPMERAEIDLGTFYLDHEDEFNIQTGGSQGRVDKASSLMAWGDNIEEDEDIGESVRSAAEVNLLPQLAGTYMSEFTSQLMRVNLAASGYIEVWEPELSTYEFLDWVRADILPYVTSVDEDEQDVSEKAEADPDQPGLDEYEDDGEDPYANLDTVNMSDGGTDDGR